MEIFKIGIKSHLRSAEPIIIGVLVCICFPYGLSWMTESNVKSYLWISVLIFILGVLPSICIHLNYYFVNKATTFFYKFSEAEITIKKGLRSETFSINDIDRIVRSMSFNLAANRAGFLPWDLYNHSTIYLNDGRNFIITSLLVPNLNLPVQADKMLIQQNIFRFAKLNKISCID